MAAYDVECFRCGYSLLGLAADQACPECGLPARFSDRPDDRLIHARPRWLRTMHRSIVLVLLAGLWPLGLVLVLPPLERWVLSMPLAKQTQLVQSVSPTRTAQLLGVSTFVLRNPQLLLLLSTLLLITGAVLLAKREIRPADSGAKSDRRRGLVMTAILPTIALAWIVATNQETVFGDPALAPRHWLDYSVACIACVPFPALLFRRLRGLAKRADRGDLAQHCTIVGVTTVLSLTAVAVLCTMHIGAKFFGVASYPLDDSTGANVVSLAIIAAVMVSYLWGLLTLARLAWALRRITRGIETRWRESDLAATGAAARR